jgi:CRISPR-associated protein Cmr4
MTSRLTFVHALSPLHAGIGQGIGVIDLPIAREKTTGLPFLPGSSLKGTLRSLCKAEDRNSIFGPETSEIDPDSNYASSVQFSDQRLLLLPVRSLAGTFAWVTSPYVLYRLLRDMQDIHAKKLPYAIPSVKDKTTCCIVNDASDIVADTSTKQVFLEDLDLVAEASPEIAQWATWLGQQLFPLDETGRQMLMDRFCLVHDDIFSFLSETATEISARIKLLEDSKTVKKGGLWYEESLPVETVLSGIVLATPTRASGKTETQVLDFMKVITDKAVQLGGKTTVGRGICRILLGEEV